MNDMAQIPDNPVTQQDMFDWYELTKELTRIKATEMLLRIKIFKHYFPLPEEGTNSADLADGYVLKGVHKIDRKIDVAALTVLKDLFAEKLIKIDDLVKWDPALKVKEYRELTAEQIQLFDRCLIVKPGSPALEIVLPKKKGVAGQSVT